MATVAAVEQSICPIANAARLLGDRWTLVILRDLGGGALRFSELEHRSGGISPRTLADRLRTLESQGMIRRESFREIPPRVQYTLTAKGEATLPVIEALRTFGESWLSPEEQECC